MRRSELAEHEVDPVPVDYAVGDTQGAIGYMLQKTLANELLRREISRPVISLVAQTRVDRQDAAFQKPNKPIGSFMSEEVANKVPKPWGGGRARYLF
ncbi:hypothetical protein [Vibrio aestuarianus]|uniref:hypothetical protein n=1 Tax=Vibrio aestuarianus TaxID=28171 RepID=UPI0015935421|nr:hypothetical protein [Vibrio aestuarianus]